MNLRDYPPQLRPYVHHGVALDWQLGDVDGRGVCPFCQEPELTVWRKKNGFICSSCREAGNVYTFLRVLYDRSVSLWGSVDHSLYDSPKKGFDKLSNLIIDKQLTLGDLTRWGIVPSYITCDPIIPIYNHEDNLANLAVIKQVEGKWRPLGTPNCKHHPFRHLHPHPYNTREVFAPEGLWDTIVLDRMLHKEDLAQRVMGIPGTSTFKEEWFDTYFKDCELTLLFDNDYRKRRKSGRYEQPAKDGIERIVEMAKAHPGTKVYYYQWGESTYATRDLPDGYDVTDLFQAGSLTPQRIYEMRRNGKPKKSPAANAAAARNGQANGTANKSTAIEPIPVNSYKALSAAWAKTIHFSQRLKDAVSVGLAVIISNPLDGDQLWARIIGPPGSGKTTVAEAFSAAKDYVFPMSTGTGFHSGYIDMNDKDKDNSLLSQMNNKTCVIKDADTLLKASGLERILSEMRDFYDGVSRARYRNTVSNIYEDLRITFLLCGTDAVRALNRTDIGERFFDCEIFGNDDPAPYIDRAFSNTYAMVTRSMVKALDDEPSGNEADEDGKKYLKAVTIGYIDHLYKNALRRSPPRMTEKAEKSLKAMARFTAILRARTKRDKETEEFNKARVEVPTRLVSIYVKLAVCLAIVLEREEIDDEVLRIVRDRVFDTTDSVELDIVRAIHDAPHGKLSVKQLAHELDLSERATLLRCQSLRYFGALKKSHHSNNSNQRGRDIHYWYLTDLVKDVYRVALHENPPKSSKPTLAKAKHDNVGRGPDRQPRRRPVPRKKG